MIAWDSIACAQVLQGSMTDAQNSLTKVLGYMWTDQTHQQLKSLWALLRRQLGLGSIQTTLLILQEIISTMAAEYHDYVEFGGEDRYANEQHDRAFETVPGLIEAARTSAACGDSQAVSTICHTLQLLDWGWRGYADDAFSALTGIQSLLQFHQKPIAPLSTPLYAVPSPETNETQYTLSRIAQQWLYAQFYEEMLGPLTAIPALITVHEDIVSLLLDGVQWAFAQTEWA